MATSRVGDLYPCGCFEPEWQARPPLKRRALPGYDERGGVFADVAAETCTVCARAWLHYHFEDEGMSRSGRWFRGLVPTADAIAAPSAREVLGGRLVLRRRVRRWSGPLAI